MKIQSVLKSTTQLPLTKSAILNILYTYGLVHAELNATLKPFGISIQQFNVLRILRGQELKPTSLETIQERMVNKNSNATRLVDKLVIKNLVEKKINSDNKRKVNLVIKPKGLELLKIVDKLIDDTEDKILSALSPTEIKELIGLLGKIRLIAK